MFQIIGIVLLFAMVFGSFIISGGKIAVVLEALPHELMAIGGAGVAAFLISNSMTDDQGAPAAASARCSRARSGRRRTTGTCSACCSCSPRP